MTARTCCRDAAGCVRTGDVGGFDVAAADVGEPRVLEDAFAPALRQEVSVRGDDATEQPGAGPARHFAAAASPHDVIGRLDLEQ